MGPQGDSLPNQASKTPDADKLSGPRVPGRDSESLRGVCFFDLWDSPTEELKVCRGDSEGLGETACLILCHPVSLDPTSTAPQAHGSIAPGHHAAGVPARSSDLLKP